MSGPTGPWDIQMLTGKPPVVALSAPERTIMGNVDFVNEFAFQQSHNVYVV